MSGQRTAPRASCSLRALATDMSSIVERRKPPDFVGVRDGCCEGERATSATHHGGGSLEAEALTLYLASRAYCFVSFARNNTRSSDTTKCLAMSEMMAPASIIALRCLNGTSEAAPLS